MIIYNYAKGSEETLDRYFRYLQTLNWNNKEKSRETLFMFNENETRIESFDNADGGSEYFYESIPFHQYVLHLMRVINEMYGFKLNSCFLHKYNGQHNWFDWRSDVHENIDQSQPVVLMSVGAKREVWKKKIGHKGEIDKNDRHPLNNGDILIFMPGFQKEYLYKMPKPHRQTDTTIQLVFRKLI